MVSHQNLKLWKTGADFEICWLGLWGTGFRLAAGDISGSPKETPTWPWWSLMNSDISPTVTANEPLVETGKPGKSLVVMVTDGEGMHFVAFWWHGGWVVWWLATDRTGWFGWHTF